MKKPRRITCIIANPIYDVVFKRLMEAPDIARQFLSLILGVRVVSLRLTAHEHTGEGVSGIKSKLFRLDFCAVIQLRSGVFYNVLIEVQKARQLGDILRFRYYLATRYGLLEEVDPETGPEPLPIIPIYLLGFEIGPNLPAGISVTRELRNTFTGKTIRRKVWPDFIQNLTHNAHIFQLPKIKSPGKTPLEQALGLFDQNLKLDNDPHRLDYDSRGAKLTPLTKRMLRELTKIQADPEMQEMMTYEDMFELEQERIIKRETRSLRSRLEEEQKRSEEAQRRSEEAQRRSEEAQRRSEDERQQREEAQRRSEDERRRREAAERELELLRKQLEDKDSG